MNFAADGNLTATALEYEASAQNLPRSAGAFTEKSNVRIEFQPGGEVMVHGL